MEVYCLVTHNYLKRVYMTSLQSFFDNVFSRYEFGFTKGYNEQQCFSARIEFCKIRLRVDNKKAFGALVTDFSDV